jgi:hypothetical protein
METLELNKVYAALYKPSALSPVILDVPPLRFLMIDGIGDVGGAVFTECMTALYGLAYPVKFAAKKRLSLSYPVMPSEGLYWNADEGRNAAPASSERTAWRLMILLPDAVSAELVDEVRAKVHAKKNVPHLDEIHVQTYSEGKSVQILHVGPYAHETGSVDRLLAFAHERGYQAAGNHHEIYINDPNKTSPEKLKTVLRYPVRKGT